MLARAVGAAEFAGPFRPAWERTDETFWSLVPLVRGELSPLGVPMPCPCWHCPLELEAVALGLIPCYELCSTGCTLQRVPAPPRQLRASPSLVGWDLPRGASTCFLARASLEKVLGNFSLGRDPDSSPPSRDEFILPNDLPTSQVQGILVWVIVCWSVFSLSPDTNILNKSHSLLSWRYKGNIPQGQG